MLKSDVRRACGRLSMLQASRFLGLAAAAFLALSTAPAERAQALSLLNPAGAPVNESVGNDLAIQVRGGHGGHGGHGGWGGGAGATVFHSSSFRAGPSLAGSGWHGGHRFAHHRFRRVFIGGAWYTYPYYDDYPYYGYPDYYAVPGCRIIVTDLGPQQVCGHRPWRHGHHRRHHHDRHHRVDR